MRRAALAFLVIPIVGAASCARASTSRDVDGVPYERVITVGEGIAVRSGPVLTALPPGQRYRFVSPDSLAMGLESDDESSIAEPRLGEFRKVFSTVMESGHWVESPDSAQFDVAIFTTARMEMRREGRAHRLTNVMPCGQAPTTNLQWCPDDPAVYTERWSTHYYTFHIIRRRSDGALRVWRRSGAGPASVGSRVATDLLEMLRAGDGR